METMPYQSKVDKVKSDVITLKNAYYTLQEYDLHIGQNTMSYITANDIEKILNDIETIIQRMIDELKYAKNFYAGQSISPFNTTY